MRQHRQAQHENFTGVSRKRGMILIFTGDGKGKTTAALGTIMRAKGAGLKIAIVFFDKGGSSHYSERKALDSLGIDWYATGRDRIDSTTGKFDFSILESDKDEARRGLALARNLIAKANHDLIVLDEINVAVSLGLLGEKDVLDLLNLKQPQTELILTGRGAPASILERADLVTEMVMKKHYFYSNIQAIEGIDY